MFVSPYIYGNRATNNFISLLIILIWLLAAVAQTSDHDIAGIA